MAAVRPCGIVVNFSEMFTCESPTQMYVFLRLSFTFGHGRDIDRLRYVVYDRSCDLHPFLCNLEKKGAYLASFLLKHVKFLVDRFHVEGHTEPCCKLPSIDDPEKVDINHPTRNLLRLRMQIQSVLNSLLSG